MSAEASPQRGASTRPVLAFTLVLAFCSIVYELLLGQALSAFLGNTVLRYSVTIGLYLMSMGVGAMLAGPRMLNSAVLSLQGVELLLTALGGASVVILFGGDALGLTTVPLSILAHGLILVIGVLTGLEIPLLIELRSHGSVDASGQVLGVDYLGAFLGTVAFALLFYPLLGLVTTAFAVAALNASVGLGLLALGARVRPERRSLHRSLAAAQAVLLGGLVLCLLKSSQVSELGVALYTGE